MDQATLIIGRASRTWDEYVAAQGLLRDSPEALPLRTMLEDLAERVFRLTVVEDETLSGTNIEGELNRDAGLILLRPGLTPDRAIYVLAHEIGHFALNHPMHRIADTADHINPNVTPDDLSVERQQRSTGLELSDSALTALRGYNPRDVYEMQANAFATELLVPSALLRAAIQEEPNVDVAVLASRLGVPEQLVRIGLAQALFVARRVIAHPPNSAGGTLIGKQNDAANCSTPALVIAGPGAGKTRVLVSRYARLVAEGTPPRQILALTFANKAASEMRERLVPLVAEEQAASVEVATFHAFGLQLLQQYGERIGLTLPLRLITPMDALLLFRRRAARMSLGILEDLPKALENLKKLLDAVARSKEENADPERWAELARSWSEAYSGEEAPLWAGDGVAFYREYQRTLRRHGLLDYGDLQMEALRLFSIPEVADEIRERYRHILVDEFQDINFVSGQLIRALDGGRGIVWVVGDPRQSIYGFRGASPVNLTRFRAAEYYPDASVVTLDMNYRSVPDIVEAGMAVPIALSGDPELIPPKLRADRNAADGMPAVTAVRLEHGSEEMRWIASEIRHQQEQGNALSDIVVLTRKNNHAAEVAAALTEAGIPHRWGGPIQNRPVFNVLTSALLLAADETAGIVGLTTLAPLPTMSPDFMLSEADRRVLLADGRGRWGARRLLASASNGQVDGLSDEGQVTCRSLHAIAMSLSSSARPHHNLCVYLFEHALWLRRLLPEEARNIADVRNILATIGQVLDLAASFAAQREALSRSARNAKEVDHEEPDHLETATSTGAFLAYLQAALQSGGLGVPNELDVEGDAVSLITAHRSKGLEWPIVFIPFCMEGQFPSSERDNDLPLPPELIATDDADSTATHLREEACLFYVAVTRAKDRLFLSNSKVYAVRTKGPVAALCQTVMDALDAIGRLNRPTVSLPELDRSPAEPNTTSETLAYSVPDNIYESDLRTYKECPRRFLFQRIYGLPEADTAFLAFYRAVYGAAKDASTDPNTLRERFEARWSEAGPPDDHWQAPLLRRAAERLVTRMEEQHRSGTPKTFRQEKSLQISNGEGVIINVRLTVDEEGVNPEGKRFFRRHKQGSRLPKKPPDEDIATLYALLADQESPGTEIAFYYPHLNESIPALIGKQKKANLCGNVVRMVSDIKQGKMPARPTDQCKRCPYALICNREGPD